MMNLRFYITELNRSKLDAQTSQRKQNNTDQLAAVGQTVAKIAHEIKNRLTVIGGFSRLINKHIDESDRVQHYSQVIGEESGKLERMLKQITDFSKPVCIEGTVRSLNELAQNMVPKIEEQKPEGITVILELDPASPRALIDAERLEQVLFNLIKNAIEAMENDGIVKICTRLEDSHATLIVQDNGPGIPEEAQSRIFEPFHTTKPKGTGLGLAICRQIITEHRGEMKFISVPGKGTSFIITFPAPENLE
jgi:signal transduction histidine kinase